MPKKNIFPIMFGLIGVTVLLSLAVWQMQRLEWKQDIISKIEERLSGEPLSLINNYKFYLSKINNIEELSKEYHNNLYGLNGCNFILKGKKVKGKVIKVLNNGQIKVDIESEGIASYRSGEIKIII